MPRNSELLVTFRRERHVFDNDDGSRTIVGSADADGRGDADVKGDADEGELYPGGRFRLFGHWKTHPRHGEQFWFASFVEETPATYEGIKAYLKQCTGVGEATAEQLWTKYGPDAVRAVRETPAEAADGIPRWSVDNAEVAAEELRDRHATERATLDLMGLLDGRGFPKKTVKSAIKLWGVAAADAIRRNPYRLLRFRGCGFPSVDKFYLDLGLPPAALKRQAYCLDYAVASDQTGSTWLPIAAVQAALRSQLAAADARPDAAAELCVHAGMLSACESGGGRFLAAAPQARAEERIADAVADAMDESLDTGRDPNWPTIAAAGEGEIGLSAHQADELAKAIGGFVGVLRGSPGTGKTFAAAAVARSVIAAHGDATVAFAAPTGKAAVRLTEALAAAGVPCEAVTIHRLLQVESGGDGIDFGFRHRPGNPLPYRYIFVDESSMIDAALMASLLDARAAGTHVLFLGDPYQLPPVGRGKPFLDLAGSIPHVGELREVRRNAGLIVSACAAMRDREPWRPADEPDPDDPAANLGLLPAGEGDIAERIETAVRRVAAGEAFDPVWETQVLVPLNDRGPASRTALNPILQDVLNAGGEKVAGTDWRVGDKVVCLKNTRHKAGPGHDHAATPADVNGMLPVANGELGEVVQGDRGRALVRLPGPDRIVWVLKGANWDLGYALSVHKSQGSEWPLAIVALDPSGAAARVGSRNWLYTAVSRAKRLCLLVGSKSTADAVCGRDGLAGRFTLLAERLRGDDVRSLAGRELRPAKPVVLTADELDAVFAAATAAA